MIGREEYNEKMSELLIKRFGIDIEKKSANGDVKDFMAVSVFSEFAAAASVAHDPICVMLIIGAGAVAAASGLVDHIGTRVPCQCRQKGRRSLSCLPRADF